MKPNIRSTLGPLLRDVLALIFVAGAALRRSDLRVEISSRQDVLDGKSFGSVGPYEKLTGKVYFAIDQKNPRNKIIADLDKAPMNAQGRVEFSA